MTDGQKMIWAATFAARINRPDACYPTDFAIREAAEFASYVVRDLEAVAVTTDGHRLSKMEVRAALMTKAMVEVD